MSLNFYAIYAHTIIYDAFSLTIIIYTFCAICCNVSFMLQYIKSQISYKNNLNWNLDKSINCLKSNAEKEFLLWIKLCLTQQ